MKNTSLDIGFNQRRGEGQHQRGQHHGHTNPSQTATPPPGAHQLTGTTAPHNGTGLPATIHDQQQHRTQRRQLTLSNIGTGIDPVVLAGSVVPAPEHHTKQRRLVAGTGG